jgi:hypothetical protein
MALLLGFPVALLDRDLARSARELALSIIVVGVLTLDRRVLFSEC